MKAIVTGRATLEAIGPLDLISYLRFTGWHENLCITCSGTLVRDGQEYLLRDMHDVILALDE